MENLVNRLEKRGWGKKEIIKTLEIIRSAKLNKGKETIFLEKRIYWILLVITIVANFAISVALMPILMSLKGMFLYFIIIVLGIVFGLLFELVIRSIEHLEKRHHQLLVIFIPLIALANIWIISNISNNLAKTLNLTNMHNPIIISIIYAVSFVLPYIIYRFIFKIEYHTKE